MRISWLQTALYLLGGAGIACTEAAPSDDTHSELPGPSLTGSGGLESPGGATGGSSNLPHTGGTMGTSGASSNTGGSSTGGSDAGSGTGGMPTEMPPTSHCADPIHVTTSEELNSAIASATPGTCIELADGSYIFEEVTSQGTEEAPVVIYAENTLQALVSSGNIELQDAAHTVIQGIHFTSSGNIRMNNCDHCRVSRFRIERAETDQEVDWVWVSGTSTHCRIDRNDFGPQTSVANMIMLAGAGSQIVQHTRIDHNYFHDIEYAGGNGWETIRAGLSVWTFSSAHSVIEHNLFVRADNDPETISIKSSDNIVRYNTMRETAGEFTLRHGNRTDVYGNSIFGDGVSGSGGLRILGGGHRIFNNYISGVERSAIHVDSGSSDDESGELTDHKVSYDVQVVFNTIVSGRGISVGSGKPLPPRNITLSSNVIEAENQAITSIEEAQIVSSNNFVGNGSISISTGVTPTDLGLMLDGDVWKTFPGSPVIDNGATTFSFVVDDIEGRIRMAPDAGAHEVGGVFLHGPLTEADVGPLSP